MLNHIISLVTMVAVLLVGLLTSAVLLLRARTRRTGLWILSASPRADRSRVLGELVHRHIRTVLTHFKGRMATWDVVNEPLYMFWSARIDDNVFFRYLGSEYIADAFRIARGVDPTAKLYMSEQLESFSDARAEAFFKLAQHLKQEGVPIDGVGLQSHFGFTLPAMEEFRAFLARLTALGLEVEITELDARLALIRGAPIRTGVRCDDPAGVPARAETSGWGGGSW
jgi:endo-1,4-beta-xylanase